MYLPTVCPSLSNGVLSGHFKEDTQFTCEKMVSECCFLWKIVSYKETLSGPKFVQFVNKQNAMSCFLMPVKDAFARVSLRSLQKISGTVRPSNQNVIFA